MLPESPLISARNDGISWVTRIFKVRSAIFPDPNFQLWTEMLSGGWDRAPPLKDRIITKAAIVGDNVFNRR